MTEQERPRTEAERLRERLYRIIEREQGSPVLGPDSLIHSLDAALEAARADGYAEGLIDGDALGVAEGRQQAVREIRGGLFESAWRRDSRDPSPREWLDPKAASAILDRVAGLNASESPDPEYDRQLVELAGRRAAERHASESPPTSLEAELSRIEATYPTWDERHPPPTADELLRDLVQHWDAGDIDHDYDAITSAFDAARDHVRATVGLSGEHRHPVAPGQQRLHATMCFDGDCPQCVGDASESGQPPEASDE